jgi:short-subunit dehydrogenase
MSVIDRPLRRTGGPGRSRSALRSRVLSLEGAVALVTGSTGDIGAAVAAELTDRGCCVIVHGRDETELRRRSRHLSAPAVGADLSDPDGAQRLAEGALRKYGQVDVVVHCAGSGHYDKLAAMTPEAVDRVIDVNLRAPLQLSRALLPAMLEAGRGHLCFLGSIAGLTGVPDEAAYSAAKAGVIALAQALRLELAGTGVGVSTVCPGAVDTGFFDGRGAPYDRRHPRLRTPDEVARVVVSAIQAGGGFRVLPRWLTLAPTVRLLAPRLYDTLALRFG